MSFQTAQNLGERLVLPNSTVMSHRAKFGISGEAPGELFSRLRYIMTLLDGLDQVAASRMGMTFDDYRTLIADEYWSYGANAVIEHAADRVVLAKCSAAMMAEVTTTTVQTFFGNFEVAVSKCPLVPGILSVSSKNGVSLEETNYVKAMFLNKTAFLQDYILTNKWTKFQK